MTDHAEARARLARAMEKPRGLNGALGMVTVNTADIKALLAERPTCATCRHWLDGAGALVRQERRGYCHSTGPAGRSSTVKGWSCADHQPREGSGT